MAAIDEFHEAIEAMADELGLDGTERDEYVGFHMEKKGYQRATTWTPPDPQGGQGGQSGGLFSGQRRQSGQRQGGQPKTYFGGKRQPAK